MRVEFTRCTAINKNLVQGINGSRIQRLNYRQFRDVLITLGLGSVSTLSNRVFEVLDRDRSGFIDWHEFLVGISTLVSGSPREVVRMAFSVFDNNGNGQLSLNEVHTLLTHMSRGGNTEENHSIVVDKMKKALTKEEFKKYDVNETRTLNLRQFEKLCWGHPELVEFILGVKILDRTEMKRIEDDVEGKGVNNREEVDKAGKLGVILSNIDSMSVQELLNKCKEYKMELKGDSDRNMLKKRLKAVVLAKYDDALKKKLEEGMTMKHEKKESK